MLWSRSTQLWCWERRMGKADTECWGGHLCLKRLGQTWWCLDIFLVGWRISISVLEDTRKLPGEATVPQSSLHLWGGCLWCSPRLNNCSFGPARGCNPLLLGVDFTFHSREKGKLGDVANNLQQLKLHEKHLAWKIRQSRKNSTFTINITQLKSLPWR